MQGGNFWSGALAGAFASVANDLLGYFIDKAGDNSFIRTKGFALLTGAVSGGVGSVLGGGNFWMGAGQGLIVTAFNFLGHNEGQPISMQVEVPIIMTFGIDTIDAVFSFNILIDYSSGTFTVSNTDIQDFGEAGFSPKGEGKDFSIGISKNVTKFTASNSNNFTGNIKEKRYMSFVSSFQVESEWSFNLGVKGFSFGDSSIQHSRLKFETTMTYNPKGDFTSVTTRAYITEAKGFLNGSGTRTYRIGGGSFSNPAIIPYLIINGFDEKGRGILQPRK